MRHVPSVPAVAPTLVDRVVTYFDPVRGAERYRARMMLAMTGGYTGGRRDRRETENWRAGAGSADADLLPDLPILRERSRDLARNAPLAGGAISTVVTNVVGTGLEPQSQIDRDVLKLDDDDANAWQRAAEREWWLWAGSQECDITRTQDFAGIQEVAFRSVLESGDLFVPKRFLERPGSPYGLKLQLIEGDRVTNPNWQGDQTVIPEGKPGAGNLVSGGIEVDRDGAPVAYHVLKGHPGDTAIGAKSMQWDRIPVFGAETGERNVYHLYRKLRPGQTRGVPYLAPVIESFKQLSRYSEAEIMAAVVGAMFTVFVTTEAGEGLSTTSSDLPARASLPLSAGAPKQDLGNGAILDLVPGEKIEVANPGRPNAQFDPFVLAMCRQVGVALEIPYEILIKHFTASYSAARAAMLEAWKFFRARRVWLTSVFCQPVYEAVISEAVARGRLAAPGFFEEPIIRQAWLGTKWTGPPAGQIDPQAEIDAAEKRMALAVSTGAQETAELTGGDIEANIKQLGKERKLRQEAGLDIELVSDRTISESTSKVEDEREAARPDVAPSQRRRTTKGRTA